MDNLDNEMCRAWRSSCFKEIPADVLSLIIEGKRRTALQNLARRYRRFFIISLLCICWVPFLAFNDIFADSKWRLLWAVVAGVYFLTASIMDYWLYKGISDIDCATMTVTDVTQKAFFYKKRHLQFMMVLIPMAVLIVGGLIYMNSNDDSIVIGAVFGIILGLAIGTKQFIDFMSDYRRIR